MPDTWYEWCGWYGVGAILSAYLLLTQGYFEGTSLWYLVLNGTGAMALMLSSYHKRNYQPFILNAVWALIAVVSLAVFVFSSN